MTTTARYETNPLHNAAEEIRLAVKVISPGSSRKDRVTKASEYAEAGIAEYWILDGDPLTLTAYALESGSYRLVGEFQALAELTACGTPGRVGLEALARR